MKALLALVFLVGASVAEAQYRCVVLPKPDKQRSCFAFGVSNGRVVGWYNNRTYGYNAVYWENGEVFELNPSNANQALAWGIHGDQVVGEAGGQAYGEASAVVWNAGAAVLSNLQRPGWGLSSAYSTNGTFQAGTVATRGWYGNVPAIWQGTADSFRSLLPPGYEEGGLSAISKSWIAGVVTRGAEAWPVIWPLTKDGAGPAILIAPDGFRESAVRGVSEVDQVGYGKRQGSPWWEALRWTGSASSVQFLNPFGSRESVANATNGKVQVGYVGFPGQDRRAALWKGTRESWLELHRFLPAPYTTSEATGVDEHGNICGFAAPSFGPTDAVMWVPIKGTLRW